MDQVIPFRDDQPFLTNPHLLLCKSSNARGPYFDSSASPPIMDLPLTDELHEVDEVYNINKDGTLYKPG